MNKTEISLSKSKLAALIAGCVVFVILGCWFTFSPPRISNPVFGNPLLLFITGLLSILFFGIAGFYSIKKLADNTPGLIISEEGITDNASALSSGFIPWTDILGVTESTVANQTFVNILLKNPVEYIEKQKNILKKRMMKMNYNSYGTVISISANSLKCSHNELRQLLYASLQDFKEKNKPSSE